MQLFDVCFVEVEPGGRPGNVRVSQDTMLLAAVLVGYRYRVEVLKDRLAAELDR